MSALKQVERNDHIFPVSKGGTNAPSNLTLACDSCNRSKGARTLAEWMRG